MKDNLYSDRRKAVDYISKQLLGPAGSEDEKLDITDKPHKKYLLGTLYPKDSEREKIVNDDNQDSAATDSDQPDDSPMSTFFQRLPASIGLSFYIEGADAIDLNIWGATYHKSKEDINDNDKVDNNINNENHKQKKLKSKWIRTPLASKKTSETVTLTKDTKVDVLNARARILSVWRPMGSGYLVTVTLINNKNQESGEKLKPEDCIYQVGFKCILNSGKIKKYPSISRLSFDDEEEELELQYENKTLFAIGHGCSAIWDLNSKEIKSVETSWIPEVEMKGIDFKIDSLEGKENNILSLRYLSKESDDLIPNLNIFLKGYELWSKNLAKYNVDKKSRNAKERILTRIDIAIQRIQAGINLIRDDDNVRKCFHMANEAMLKQMAYASCSKERERNSLFEKPKFDNNEHWRPFQLAFQLLIIESLVNPNSDYRDTVDLIWFPTGGGKTESYLAIAAFELIYRRIKFKEKGFGTSVIKRYTLRLLTAQQFERAASLICALELMRQNNEKLLLKEPFTLGLWVGETTTPNRFTDSNEKGAKEKLDELLAETEPKNTFQLQKCPVCGTKIIPSRLSQERDDYGIIATEGSFKFYCPSNDCDLHDRIPVTVIDEDIYQNPPSFVIGTIDKFARLAWDHRAKSLFGDDNTKPPYLIIQDELHLISGPLGTIAGIYEAALSTIIKSKESIEPKYVSATATIRRSVDQIQKLYGKETNIFPPPGLSAEDSYFAKTDNEGIGRLYLGLMPQGHTGDTSLVNTTAALSQIPIEADLNDENLKDAYWTQIIYHNSRRELGKTVTKCYDDIPSRVNVIASDQDKKRKLENVEELSATRDSSDIPLILAKLNNKFDHKNMIDILPCTNMISVGVDVSRLGLMTIFGQPKTTAEYIQASSRIGRKSGTYPGIVVTLYSASKPRDRSHYENFVPYHNSIYRYVEPTSVTPYAPRALERALHAAFIILMRHAGNLSDNEDAKRFNPNDKDIKKLIDLFKKRLLKAATNDKERIEDWVDNIIKDWQEKIHEAIQTEAPLRYESKNDGKQFTPLMTQYGKGKKNDSWKTLNSMRNVDAESVIEVKF
jgi:hypothetical protein